MIGFLAVEILIFEYILIGSIVKLKTLRWKAFLYGVDITGRIWHNAVLAGIILIY
jgi:hypothetical protein